MPEVFVTEKIVAEEIVADEIVGLIDKKTKYFFSMHLLYLL